MVAMAFNAAQYSPQYGGGGGGLPAGPNGENVKYKVVLINSSPVDTKDNFGNVKGGYLAFEMACIEGPHKDTKHTDRLNLHHNNPTVVDIANKQLSAYCHVTGVFQFNDTAMLHGKPFIVEIGLQKGEDAKAKGYTEVKALYDINGNEPGKAGSGPQANQGQNGGNNQGGGYNQNNNPPAGGVTAQGGWGDQNNQGGGQGQNNGQGGGFGGDQNNQGQGGNGGGFNQGNGQNNGGQGGGWGGQGQGDQNQAGQGQGGGQAGGGAGWGGNNQGGNNQGQNGGGGAGWGGAGGGGQGGGSAGWGGR